MKTTKRSVLSVVAGLVAIFVVTTAIDAVLHVANIFPPLGTPMAASLFALALSYRVIVSVAGSWLTARLAPRRPLAHALVLGGIGFVLSVVGGIAFWDQGQHWYPISLALSAPFCAWLGAALHAKQPAQIPEDVLHARGAIVR